MYKKTLLVSDIAVVQNISATSGPDEAKAFAREVSRSDQGTWHKSCGALAKWANLLRIF